MVRRRSSHVGRSEAHLQTELHPRRLLHVRRLLQTKVAAAFAVPVHELAAATRRSAPIAFARQSAMYLAHVVLGLNYTEAGRVFGRDRTTAAYACRLVEQRRDDPTVDAALHVLEQQFDRFGDNSMRREGGQA